MDSRLKVLLLIVAVVVVCLVAFIVWDIISGKIYYKGWRSGQADERTRQEKRYQDGLASLNRSHESAIERLTLAHANAEVDWQERTKRLIKIAEEESLRKGRIEGYKYARNWRPKKGSFFVKASPEFKDAINEAKSQLNGK